MSIGESLVVTALGMGVVFIGLVLCIAFIDLFKRLAARVSWADGHGHGAQAPAAAVAEAAPGEPVPPDVLAVITAVLEVERALYVGRYRSRLTLRRS
jgi:sodium pump decarboxylase gamma subunit